MVRPDPQEIFGEHYYATGCGLPYQRDEHWTTFFGRIADEIVTRIAPRTLLDAGCALGLLVEQLHLRGVRAEGVDISEFAISHAPEVVRPYVRQASVAEPFGERYDLIVCIEVLEHMPQPEAERAIVNFCAHSDDILFSSSPLDFREATHINVHPSEHWAELFARQGFLRDVDFDASFITPWAVRFRRRSDTLPRVVRDYERRFWELWKETTDLRDLAIQQQRTIGASTERMGKLQADVVALHEQLADRDRQLIALHEQLADRDRQLIALHEQLADRDRQLVALHEQIYQTIQEYQQLAAESSKLNNYVRQTEADLVTKVDHINELKRAIVRLESGRVMRLLQMLKSWRGRLFTEERY